MKSNIRLVIADVDGTLVTKAWLSASPVGGHRSA